MAATTISFVQIDLKLKRCYLFQHLSEVYEIAAIKTEGLEEREQIGRVSAHGGVHIVDAFGLVEFENLPRQLRPDTLPHVLGVHPERGDPGAFLYPETEGHDVADHEAGNRLIEFGHKTGVTGAQGMILD